MGIGAWMRALREGRLGFTMDEVMTGWHEFEPGEGPAGPHPFEFRVTWGPRDVRPWATPGGPGFLRQPLSGTVTAGGLCDATPCEGTLELRYFDDQTLRYAFVFAVDGRRFRFAGQKVNILPWNLPVSHTTCFGVLTDADTGRLVARSVTHFRLGTTPAFLASFRVVEQARDPIADGQSTGR